MSKRFVVNENEMKAQGNILNIFGSSANHINVLRHKAGDILEINENIVRVLNVSKENIECEIVGLAKKRGEPKTEITLYQGYLKSDKMENITQKSVELGVKHIVPFLSKNTVVKLDDKDKIKKVERLGKIAGEAIQQCGRTDNVTVCNVENFKDLIDSLKQNDINVLAYELSSNSLKEVLKGQNNITKVGIIVGSEGGFEQGEIDFLMSKLDNIYEVSLGERILRSETASAYLLSIIGYEFN